MFINVRHACLQCTLLRSSFHRKISTTYLRYEKKKNYYDILGVKNDCTQKDLKTAYIHLSKIHHPDGIHNVSKEDKEFKIIVEAYQVLSRPHSRTNYDNHLRGIETVTHVRDDIVHRPYEYAPEHRYKPIKEDHYYGIKGVKKVANWKIVMACALFCLFGIILQVFAISHSITFKREIMVKKSAEANKHHEEARKLAEDNANSANLVRVLTRMSGNDD